MCSANDHPPYDPPELPRASVALAVLGTMLTEAEAWRDGTRQPESRLEAESDIRVLRLARDRVAAAESAS